MANAEDPHAVVFEGEQDAIVSQAKPERSGHVAVQCVDIAGAGADYFGARYMSSSQGRFTSVDPIYLEKERLMDPQRLNLYAIPASRIVRLGRAPINSIEPPIRTRIIPHNIADS